MSAPLFNDRERREFSLERYFGQLAENDFGRSSLEKEMLEEAARLRGEELSPIDTTIPWELLSKRALTTTGPSGGGQFGTEHVSAPAQALSVGGSLIGRLRLPVVEVPAATARLPQYPVPADAQWLPDELSGIEVEQPTIGAARVQPKTLASLVTYSRDFARDTIAGPMSLEQWLTLMAARTVDRALLTGTGTEGAPLGLSHCPGVQSGTIDGTDTHGDLLAIEEAIEAAEGRNTAWIASPAGKRLLRSRATSSDGEPIWSADRIDGVPAISTPICPDGVLYAGDWSQATIFTFGGGIKIASRHKGRDLFGRGAVQLRLLVDVDILFATRQRFAVASLT